VITGDHVLPSPLRKLNSDQNDAGQDSLHGKAQLEDVTIEGAPDLQDSIKAGIDDRLKQWGWGINSDVVEALAEVVRDVLQNNGYLQAKVRTETSVLNADPAEQQVSLRFRVSEGQEYRLGEIQFANTHVFPARELRNQFPLHDGDVFNMAKIRQGLEASRRLYVSVGYINFVADPDLQIDKTSKRVSVTLEIEEGEQFRVGSVDVLGLSPENSDTLVIRLKPGDIFRQNLIEEFYKDNKSVIPGDASLWKNTEINQDNTNRTAAIVFDFRGCQEPPSSIE
jgi:outer membrane protein assembly factor BamA